jgi:hypothetical protein
MVLCVICDLSLNTTYDMVPQYEREERAPARGRAGDSNKCFLTN